MIAYRASMANVIKNKLAGKITDIRTGPVVTHLSVQVGENVIRAMVLPQTAAGYRAGDPVVLVVKATDVSIERARGQAAD